MHRNFGPLSAFAVTLAWSPALVAAAEDVRDFAPTVTVTGTGQVSAKPDTAEITVGVVSTAVTASSALQANNENMERLLDLLVKRGVPEKDVQTVNFSVAPNYRYPKEGGAREVTGYQVTDQVRVTVRKLETLGVILDELVGEGANTVNSISFSVTDAVALMDLARRKAMMDARRKAELYAEAAGRSLGPAMEIEEQTVRLPSLHARP